MKEKKMGSRMIVTLGLLTAVEIVLSRFCSISAWNIKIGLAFCTAGTGGHIVWPSWQAERLGAVANLIGALLFPDRRIFSLVHPPRVS